MNGWILFAFLFSIFGHAAITSPLSSDSDWFIGVMLFCIAMLMMFCGVMK